MVLADGENCQRIKNLKYEICIIIINNTIVSNRYSSATDKKREGIYAK